MPKAHLIFTFLFFTFAFALYAPTHAQGPQPLWSTYGILINDTPGNTAQQAPQIIGDSGSGFILVWEDGRAGYYDIYAQRVDKNGHPLWAKEGVAVCSADGNQNFPRLAADSQGGAIVVWQDYRNGNADIFAQKIDRTGSPLWDEGGVRVCTAEAGQFSPDIIADGKGGVFIAWHDYRGAKGEDIYAQRLDQGGNALWQNNGVAVSTAAGTQWYPKIASDGREGALLVWTDGRAGSFDNNIFAQRLDPSGKPLWKEDGVALSEAKNNQEKPVILPLENGAIVAWNDARAGNVDIYAQKIDLDGNPKWEKDGVVVCAYPYPQQDIQLSSDGFGGAVLVWTDSRAEESDIYAQRIFNDGRAAWQENGRAVCRVYGTQKKPQVVKLANEEWLIIWEDDRNKDIDLFAQKINNAGTPMWRARGEPLVTKPKTQDSAVVALSPAGQAVVVWQDSRSGNFDIYAQMISPDGSFLWKKSGATICNAAGSVVQQNIDAVHNGKGEIILAFEDGRAGFMNIYVQKITKAGQIAWGRHGIPIAKVAADQRNPHLVADGRGGAIVSWEDHRIQGYPRIRAQHIDIKGKKLWESSLPLASSKSRQANPIMIPDGGGGAIVCWEDDRDVLSLVDIYAQRVNAKGKLLWGSKGKAIISANGEQIEAAMIPDEKGGFFFTWTDFRRGDRNPDIYAQRINAKGDPLWGEEGALVCGAPDVQRTPQVISDEEGGILVSWTDRGGGSYDIYAQRMDGAGKPQWMRDGIPINQTSRTQQNPKFGNRNVLVWEDYRFGNWDIFSAAVDPSGKLSWGEDGVPIALMPQTQYAPRIIPWKNGSVIIAWEDYRSAKQYEVFLQKLGADGRPAWPENGVKILSKDGGRSARLLPTYSDNSLYVFWEDYTGGGKAIYGQRFRLN